MAASSDHRSRRSIEFQQGYEATFDPPLEVKYVCPICLAALREAVQTTCGHRFCQGCLATLINGQPHVKCPVDKKWLLSDLEIFPDVAIRREVLSLYVRCHNHSQGCPWVGELRELEFHDEGCGFILTPCSNECGEMVCTDMLDTHNQICPKRLVLCQHCQTQVIFSEMTKHQVLICKKFPVNCTLCGKMGINREDIPKHVDSSLGDCPQAMVLCQFAHIGCTAKEPRQKLGSHYEEQAHFHLELIMASSEQRFEMMAQKINALSHSLDLLTRMSGTNSSSLLIEEAAPVASPPQMAVGLQTVGNVYWRLDLREGSDGRHSCPPFYTGFPGYKLCVSLDLREASADRSEESPYTYLCVEIQEGEFDSSLTFPVSGWCRVTLFDQSEGASKNNHSVSFRCTDLKPSDDGESSVQSSRFLPHSEILKYCRDQVLYFELSVTPLLVNSSAELEN